MNINPPNYKRPWYRSLTWWGWTVLGAFVFALVGFLAGTVLAWGLT